MKICYIGDGDSIHNHFMVEWFARRGHQVLFLTDTPEHAPACEVRQVAPRHGFGVLRHLYATARVRRAIRQWKPDIVHAHNVTGYGYWGGLSGFSPLVMTAWGSDLNVLARRSPLVRTIVSFCLKRADLITADARDLCRTAQELAGNKADVRLMQWGVELPLFDIALPGEVRNRFRGDADFVFISTRRLRPLYNLDVILRAFARALPEIPRSRLVIVGQDTLYDSLRRLTQDLGIEDRVLFTGWITRDEMVAALLSADAFVSVPSTDSTALSLLEAFAARLGVIVADLPANREWVEPGQNGLLVPPGDGDSLRDAMIQIGRSPQLARQWGERNRELARERGDRDRELRRLESWYSELSATAGRSRTAQIVDV